MHNTNNSFGLDELKDDVQEAGKITGKARREIEEKIGGGDWSPICSHSSINEIKEMLKAIKTLDEEVKNNEGK